MHKTKQATVVGLKELRENMNTYISLIAKGMRFTVVRRSKPVFSLAPADDSEEAGWETVVDFTKIKRGGVDIKEVIKRLK